MRSEVFKTGLAGMANITQHRVAVHAQEAIVDRGMKGEGAANQHRLARAQVHVATSETSSQSRTANWASYREQVRSSSNDSLSRLARLRLGLIRILHGSQEMRTGPSLRHVLSAPCSCRCRTGSLSTKDCEPRKACKI